MLKSLQSKRKVLAAAAIVLASTVAAFALNVDQTRTPQARVLRTQQTMYYRLQINYNDPRISTPQVFGKLLQNTFVNRIMCEVATAFNASTTNVVTLGVTSPNANELTGAAGVTPGTPGIYDITAANTRGTAWTSVADVLLYAKYTQTGTAATAGQANCVIEFTPNNDM